MTDPTSPPAEEPAPTWEGIARDHGRFVYTVAYRLTGNHEDAQDLVQEVLLRVRKGLMTYNPGALHAWLARITTNAFLDDVRRQKRRPLEVMPDVEERVATAAPDADAALAATRLPDHVQDAIRLLPDDFRAVVVLCDIVGLDYAEIGEALSIPPGTVRSRIHRGRAQLRQVLA
ncbi:MAG TPA: sigma-70 family RNA polymerase sigma factor [Acidimicrobiales bacterium]